MRRRAFNIAFACGLAAYATSLVLIAVAPRTAPQPGWVRVAAGVAIALIPVLFVMAAAKMLDWFRRQLAAARQRAQGATRLCAHCGYDLRATPDRCPGCGTPAGPKP